MKTVKALGLLLSTALIMSALHATTKKELMALLNQYPGGMHKEAIESGKEHLAKAPGQGLDDELVMQLYYLLHTEGQGPASPEKERAWARKVLQQLKPDMQAVLTRLPRESRGDFAKSVGFA